MEILVPGAAGFIESNLSRCLLQERDHSVTVVDKLTYAGISASLDDLKSKSRLS